jgi:hypothetical protein
LLLLVTGKTVDFAGGISGVDGDGVPMFPRDVLVDDDMEKGTATMTRCSTGSHASWNGVEGWLEKLRASARCRRGRTQRFAALIFFLRASEDAVEQGREKGPVRCGTTLLYWPNRRENGGSPGGFPMKNFVDLKTPLDQEEEGKRRGQGGE